ncbi:MAG TPA: hypothetical protein VFX98_02015, partial [Longimicrobiaceae bacterium]|nr:hypothetical protein [Longimicrobiaceae bacterium]
MRRLPLLMAVAALLAGPAAAPAQVRQEADTAFRPAVPSPAYPAGQGPRVLFDEAHLNFHTASGRYKPFVDLVTADGYRVTPNAAPFSAATLAGHDVLVIANAAGARG